ncbi:MAG: YafY family protein [Pseudomonadota bacterium]
MRRADRLIKIVHYLRRRRRAVTAQKISEAFDICTRTVYRDIQDLMNSGVPIFGEAGVGYVIDKKYHLPPVTFDGDELEAIALGISMVRQWTDDRFAAKAENAFEKIQAVLPASLLDELEQITTFSLPSRHQIPWRVSFSDIREAIRRKHKLALRYLDLKDQTTQRTVRPLGLVFFSPVWLLIAWCEKRKDFRNFRLDRIEDMLNTNDSFIDAKGKSLAAYIESCRGGE